MARREMFQLAPIADPRAGVLARLGAWLVRSIQNPAVPIAQAYDRLVAGPPTSSGIVVTEQTALTIAAVWGAVQVIAGAVGSLPLFMYKRTPGGGKERMTWARSYRLLHDEPNPEMSAAVFRETLQGHVLLWGNGYAEIERTTTGEPLALWPLTPDRVTPDRIGVDKRLVYRVANYDRTGRDAVIEAADMLHIPGLGFDGTCGYSVVRMARESLGLTKAIERYGSEFFSKGARSGGVFEHPGKLSDTARAHIKDSLNNLKAHEYAVLEEGMKLERWSIPPDDSQFLASRQFQVVDVCRWFQLSPIKLADLSRSTYSNSEQEELSFVVNTLRRWLVRWEQEINRKLVRPLERSQQFAEHLVDGLLRGDAVARSTLYREGRMGGWFSINDIREMENLNPVPGGDVYLAPMNMVPTGMLAAFVESQIAKNTPPPAAPAASEASAEMNRMAQAWTEGLAGLRQEIATRDEAARQADAAGESAAAAVIREEVRGLWAEHKDMQERAMAEVLEQVAATRTQAADTLSRLEADIAARAAEPAPPAEPPGPVEVAGMADLVAQIRADSEAAAARQQAVEETIAARLAQTETVVTETVAALREGAAKTADRVQGRLRALNLDAAQREQLRQTHAGILAAQRHLIQDAMRRVVHREANAARKAAATPEKLRAWMDTFYTRRQPMIDAVMPALSLHVVLARSVEPAASRAEALITAHVTRSRAELEALAEAADHEAAVEALTARWEQDRPGQVADELMGEVTAHVDG